MIFDNDFVMFAAGFITATIIYFCMFIIIIGSV